METTGRGNIPEDQRRTLLTRGIVKLEVRKKLENLDLENKVINHILLLWLEEWTINFQDKIWKKRCERTIKWKKENGITAKTKRKKREGKKL
ncbi:10664_t:CDS:2 [Gigaspora margarita]|uniref:10664_t:CDS:1 n=1 Tax=Gigaspora margarita TaxID=4874 RepID=A0ABN7UJW4_GIGMA|nr:10664_t:CDS:2 [Gigaspora margarita]